MSWLTILIVVFYAVGYLVTWRRLAWSYCNNFPNASLTEAIAVTAFSSMAWPGFVAHWAIKSLDVDLMWLIEPRSVRRDRERRERESKKTPTQKLIDRYVKGAISFEQFDAGVDEILAGKKLRPYEVESRLDELGERIRQANSLTSQREPEYAAPRHSTRKL